VHLYGIFSAEALNLNGGSFTSERSGIGRLEIDGKL
jgi:hypothetical protein